MQTLNHSLLKIANHSFVYLLDNAVMQGDRINEVMQQMGWTRADLCRQITSRGHQVTEQAIGKWLTGATQNIKGEYFFAIQDASGYSARWMIEGKGSKKIQALHPLDAFKQAFDEADDMAQRMAIDSLRLIKGYKKEIKPEHLKQA
jgi:transcriptional regulator with XRE-family HTH domain